MTYEKKWNLLKECLADLLKDKTLETENMLAWMETSTLIGVQKIMENLERDDK